MSEHPNWILELSSVPSMAKNAWKVSTVRSWPKREQAREIGVDLIGQGEVLVTFGILDLVHPDSRNRTQGAMCQAPVHDKLHGAANLVPKGAEWFGGFLPRQFARAARQEENVGFGEEPSGPRLTDWFKRAARFLLTVFGRPLLQNSHFS
jgi:hypothetical protein